MRIVCWGVVVCALIVAAGASARSEDAVDVPAGARIRLEPDRTAWRLGENVIVRYVIENASDEPFTVDWGGDSRAVRAIRNIVRVYDDAGALLPDPWPDPVCFGGPGGPAEVTMSTPFVIEIPVPRYRMFEKPGRYRIRVLHDLGWDEDRRVRYDGWPGGGPPEDDPRWAETTVEMFEPPADQVDAILDVMGDLPERGDQHWGRKNRAWSDFETLRHPAYLEALTRRARTRRGFEPHWLRGLQSIETREATEALLELLQENTTQERAAALLDRVPLPEPVTIPIDHVSVVGPDRTRQARLARTAWDDAFSTPLRAWARSNLGGRYAGRVPNHAAYFLSSVGTPEDLPALTDGLSQALQYAEAEPKRWEDPTERGRLAMVYGAILRLYRRGAKPPDAPVRAEEIALALLWILEKGEEVLPPYEARVGSWLAHGQVAIRDLALRCLPRPLPKVVVDHLGALLADEDEQMRITALQAVRDTRDERFRDAVTKELRRADESWWLMTAEGAAEAVGIDIVERMRIHASALGEASAYPIRLRYLIRVFGNHGYSSSAAPDAEERTKLVAAWLRFLDENAEAIRAGQTFDHDDPDLADLIPSTVDIH